MNLLMALSLQTALPSDAVHLHLITNHIPIFFLLAGIISSLLAAFTKSSTAMRISLVLLILGALGGLVTYWWGQEAYKPVRGLADEEGQNWLDIHMARADSVLWLLWLCAAVSAAGLAGSFIHPAIAKLATVVAAVLSIATFLAALWVAEAGGKVRHPEIRTEQAPSEEPSDSDSR